MPAKKKAKKTRKKTVTEAALIISWTESERGWGQRPDGYSVHLSQDDVTEYIKEYWAREKERNPSGAVPDEYTRPDSERGRMVVVSGRLRRDLKKALKEGRHGVRLWQCEYRQAQVDGEIVEAGDL